MPKSVFIMRHAKSSWAQSGIPDHDRPLNKRGIADAPAMGRMLVEHKLVPQKLYHSSAKRTVLTAELLCKQFAGEATIGGDIFDRNSIESMEELYLAPWTTYVELMMHLAEGDSSEQLNSIMLLGHNPGLETLIEKLTGRYQTMPTATVVWIEMASDDWGDSENLMVSGGFRLMDIWRPKEL